MNRITLKNLFDAARNDAAPMVEVADAVMLTLSEQGRRQSVSMPRPLVWLSVASSAAAAALVLAAMHVWRQGDAVNDILHLVSWAAQ